jgi:hypothetical protein
MVEVIGEDRRATISLEKTPLARAICEALYVAKESE